MLNVLDGLINQNRFDVPVTAEVITAGLQGLWVAPTADGYDLVATPKAAFQICTESNNDGTAGFTEDAKYWKRVAVLSGTYRAETDLYAGNPAIGDNLTVDETGKLAVTTTAGDPVYAVCLKAPYAKTIAGKSFNVIEYMTVNKLIGGAIV